MSIVPLHNYVLVKVENPEEATLPGGIVVSSISQRVMATGTVEAVGPSTPRTTLQNGTEFPSVGQKVLFPPSGVGEDYEPRPGERYKFLTETEILAVVG